MATSDFPLFGAPISSVAISTISVASMGNIATATIQTRVSMFRPSIYFGWSRFAQNQFAGLVSSFIAPAIKIMKLVFAPLQFFCDKLWAFMPAITAKSNFPDYYRTRQAHPGTGDAAMRTLALLMLCSSVGFAQRMEGYAYVAEIPASGEFNERIVKQDSLFEWHPGAGQWQFVRKAYASYHKDSVGTGGPGSTDSSVFATTARMADSLDNFSRLAHAHVSGGAGMAIVGQVWRSVTMTNIGNAYKDVYSGTAFDQEHLLKVDFTGITSIRLVWLWDYVGTGTQQVRVADLADNNNVLVQSATFTADQDPGDSGWLTLPAAFVDATKRLEFQGKSTTAGDDPVAKGYILYVK